MFSLLDAQDCVWAAAISNGALLKKFASIAAKICSEGPMQIHYKEGFQITSPDPCGLGVIKIFLPTQMFDILWHVNSNIDNIEHDCISVDPVTHQRNIVAKIDFVQLEAALMRSNNLWVYMYLKVNETKKLYVRVATAHSYSETALNLLNVGFIRPKTSVNFKYKFQNIDALRFKSGICDCSQLGHEHVRFKVFKNDLVIESVSTVTTNMHFQIDGLFVQTKEDGEPKEIEYEDKGTELLFTTDVFTLSYLQFFVSCRPLRYPPTLYLDKNRMLLVYKIPVHDDKVSYKTQSMNTTVLALKKFQQQQQQQAVNESSEPVSSDKSVVKSQAQNEEIPSCRVVCFVVGQDLNNRVDTNHQNNHNGGDYSSTDDSEICDNGMMDDIAVLTDGARKSTDGGIGESGEVADMNDDYDGYEDDYDAY